MMSQQDGSTLKQVDQQKWKINQDVEDKDRSYKFKQKKHSQSIHDMSTFHRFVDENKKVPVAVMLIVLLLVGLGMWKYCAEQPQSQLYLTRHMTKLPKIMWIYSRCQIQAQMPNLIIYLDHLNQTALKCGYQVRVVNSWNSYNWLSNQTTKRIGKIMQNNKIDETVDNLLKIALLMQNGGIMIGNLDTIILEDSLLWLQQMLSSQTYMGNYSCIPEKSQIFMPSFYDNSFGYKYHQNIIAAIPNSNLMNITFNRLSTILTTGQFQGLGTIFMEHNDYTNIDYLPYAIENVVSVILREQYVKNGNSICQSFGMQGSHQQWIMNLNDYGKRERSHLLFNKRHRDIKQKIIINANTTSVNVILGHYMTNKLDIKRLPTKSIMYHILNSTNNRKVFLEPLPPRQINLCLIVMQQLDPNQLQTTLKLFRQQTYDRWQLILFSKGDLSQIQNNYARVVKGSGSQLRNIQLAVTRYCHPKGYAVLMNYGDRFNYPQALSIIASTVRNRQIVGAAISLQIKGQVFQATQDHINFSRSRDSVINPKLIKISGILNHFRIMAIESFRIIPQYDLRDIYGQYYQDRVIVPMILLEMINKPRNQFEFMYVYKKYEELWNVPQRAIIVPHIIKIIAKKADVVSFRQLERIRAQYDVEAISTSIDQIFHWDVPFTKLVVLNNGDNFTSVNDKQGQFQIPQVIHQVWLGGQLPPAQQYFFNKAKQIYPNYQLKLWKQQNITKQTFPLTYDLIINLIDYHKNRKSVFNKLATITDIMRHQILYHQGGFWRDAGMNLFRPIFDKFIRYKLVVGAEKTFRSRWNQGMCFFGNRPRLQNMGWITGHANINRMRIYTDIALSIAGPFDFRQILNGMEEYDPEILVLPFEAFYPGQINRPPLNDLCTRYQPQYKGQSFQFLYKGCYLLSNCEQKYPNAYGLDHNCFGVSWMKKIN